MKKLIVIVALLSVFGAGWASEPMADAPDSTTHTEQSSRLRHFGFGLTAGQDRNYHVVDMSYMSDMEYTKYEEGYSIGGQITYRPVRWFSLRIEAVLLQKNYRMDHVKQLQSVRYYTYTLTENRYVNVPLTLALHMGKTVRVSLFGGVYGGYWLTSHRSGESLSLSSRVYGDEEVNAFDEDVVFDERRDNREDAGFVWGAGVSAMLFRQLELGADVRWYYGVYDIQKEYQRGLNPRYNTTMVMQAGLTYWL